MTSQSQMKQIYHQYLFEFRHTYERLTYLLYSNKNMVIFTYDRLTLKWHHYLLVLFKIYLYNLLIYLFIQKVYYYPKIYSPKLNFQFLFLS